MSLLETLINEKRTCILTMEECQDTVRGLAILYANNVEFETFKKEENPDLVEDVIKKYNFKYYPTIFIKGEFIGGDKELDEYFKIHNEIKRI
ncbi:glutaredoxin [Vairimorpha necatrix]|uniref:Glutaredoxin n=1 Tax=Vairimorpha necatrix TaxID=6039 RepID=A0AAX4JAP5_9MICR